MIAYNSYVADGFIYLSMYIGPHEHGHPMLNANDGYFAQSLYVVNGSGTFHVRDTEDGTDTDTAVPAPGNFLEIGEHYDKFISLSSGDSGLALVFFNPLPITNTLSYEKLTAGTHTVSASGETTKHVVCVNGPIGIGTQQLLAHQHAKVKPGQSFPVEIPEHSLAIAVTVS